MVRRYHEAIEAYDEDQVQEVLATLPDAVHTGQGLRVAGKSYVSLNQLVTIISQKYSFADPTYKGVETLAHEIIKTDDDLYFTKRFRARTHRGALLYTAQTMVTMEIGQSIVAAYRDEL